MYLIFDVLLLIANCLDRSTTLSLMRTCKDLYLDPTLMSILLRKPWPRRLSSYNPQIYVQYFRFLLHHPPGAPRLPHLRELTLDYHFNYEQRRPYSNRYPPSEPSETTVLTDLVLRVLTQATSLEKLILGSDVLYWAKSKAREIISAIISLTTLKSLDFDLCSSGITDGLLTSLQSPLSSLRMRCSQRIAPPSSFHPFRTSLRRLDLQGTVVRVLCEAGILFTHVELLSVDLHWSPVTMKTARLMQTFPALRILKCTPVFKGDIHRMDLEATRQKNSDALELLDTSQSGAWSALDTVCACLATLYTLTISQHIRKLEISHIGCFSSASALNKVVSALHPRELLLEAPEIESKWDQRILGEVAFSPNRVTHLTVYIDHCKNLKVQKALIDELLPLVARLPKLEYFHCRATRPPSVQKHKSDATIAQELAAAAPLLRFVFLDFGRHKQMSCFRVCAGRRCEAIQVDVGKRMEEDYSRRIAPLEWA